MALVLKDRVRESSTTTGTGTVTLGGAYDGYRTFASCIPDGSVVYYCIHNTATGFESEWEVGYGTFTLSGTTLSRTSIYSSSNAGSAVNFSAGTKEVFITYPAEQAVFQETNGNLKLISGVIEVSVDGTEGTTLPNATFQAFATVDGYIQNNIQNLSDGSDASGDFVATNDQGDDESFYVDVGINSSNFSSVDYPIYSPNSTYLFGVGDGAGTASDLYVGSGDGDVILHAGGWETTNVVATASGTDQSMSFEADVNVGGALDVTGATTFGSTVTLNADPTLALQAATKQYVDNATSNGFHVHTPVLVATTGNLTATYNQPGGATVGVGATLTNSGAQAALSIDGVSLSVNDRVLVWQQTTGTQNGVYVVTTVGDGSTNWVLTRSTDTDEAGEASPDSLGGGDYFFVSSGATLGFFSFVCTNTDTITFGTTDITFTEFSQVPSYIVNAPLNLSGNTLSLSGTVAATNGGTGTNTVTTGDLLYGSASNTWSKLAAGSAYKSLVMNAGGTNVEWNAVALNQSGAVSGALPATNGGTAQSSYTLGDTLYSSATNTLSKLAGNTTTTKKYLQQQGDGANSAAPSWQQVAAADISGLAASATTDTTNASNISSGTLPSGRMSGSYTGITGVGTLTAGTWNATTIGVGYGGTGLTSYTTGDIVYASGSGTLASLADVATGNALISGGVGVAPSYGKVGLTTHITGTLALENGGTGQTSASAAINALVPSQTGNTGKFLTTNGSAVSWNTVPAPNNGTLTMAVSGTGLSGSASFTADQAGNSTFTVTSNATSANTVSTIVARDASGNFSAGTITAALSGNATTATTASSCSGNAATATALQTARTINGVSFDGTANINVNTNNTLTRGSYLTGDNFNGSAATTWAVDATSDNTASKVVARDASGNFSAGTITATLSGNASTVTNGVYTNSSAAISGDNYFTFGPNSSWGAYLRVGGNGRTVSGNTYGSVVVTDGNVHIDSGDAKGLYLNYYAGTSGIKFGGGASNIVGFTDSSGNLAMNGNITAYYSDERLKTKVGDIENALDKVDQLSGFLYVENDLAKSLGYNNTKQQVALSAQAVQKVQPEAVSLAPFDMETKEDGTIVSKSGEEYLTVDYARLVPLLVEAIKELRAEVKALKGE